MKKTVLRVNGVRGDELAAVFDAALRNLMEINTVRYDPAVYNRTGLLPEEGCFIRAGDAYEQPWTRDTAINCWNAASLLTPEAARNTLWSVCERTQQGRLIVQRDYQWWDKVIWVRGAWEHFSVTGDREFLAPAREAATETLAEKEAERFNSEYGLFMGPAVMADGIAGYPVPPASADGHADFVLEYPESHRLMCLSTNCTYFDAYQCLAGMAEEMGEDSGPWRKKAAALAAAINRHLWRPETGTYGYFIHGTGSLVGRLNEHQEGLGLALAVLTGVADSSRTAQLMKNVHIQPKGIVPVWPHFEGFHDGYPGRHNVMCWPMIGGFWAEAAMRGGWPDLFYHEMMNLAANVTANNGEFFELYDSVTGAIHGGYQPVGPHGRLYNSCHHQTWSATAFLRMIFRVLLGMRFTVGRMQLEPMLPPEITAVELRNLPWRGSRVRITVSDGGRTVRQSEENS
jgi:glycogen debranching enzyme